ncbi:hypothetical protein [Paucidesulfovibrio longus]|uniref:hypothetical protein n=1 Tax=Paucidesulfovibrio longus TaxID=889 RepID=UPI001F1D2A7E|nr:hypothetical protein [Paucidesulfovibrio longus]
MIKLALPGSESWTYEGVAHDLGMSSSMAHSAVKRSTQARLFDSVRKRPRRGALEEFLVHGVKYAFPPDIGSVTRGVPTAQGAPVLQGQFVQSGDDLYVWPHAEGEVRGMSLSPLFKSVSKIVQADNGLYRALALLDAIRIGRAREQKLAGEMLTAMLRGDNG